MIFLWDNGISCLFSFNIIKLTYPKHLDFLSQAFYFWDNFAF
ncbi:hypothetical protein HMPREF3203_03285 [Proteus mirabilis]|nr:hypothetical protein HMPREF3203_03285 [Proteus mirabilis]